MLDLAKDVLSALVIPGVLVGTLIERTLHGLRTITEVISRRDDRALAPIIRLQLECVIQISWVLRAPIGEREKRIRRIMLSFANECLRSARHGGDETEIHVAEMELREIRDAAERDGYGSIRQAPTLRDMTVELEDDDLYAEYRMLSSATHAGYGMVWDEGRVDNWYEESRAWDAVLSIEKCYRLLRVTISSLSEAPNAHIDRRRMRDMVETFRIEYFDKLRDALFAHLWKRNAAMHSEEEAKSREFLSSALSLLKPFGVDRNSFNIPKDNKMPLVGVTDTVRIRLGKSLYAVSVRIRNHSEHSIHVVDLRFTKRTKEKWSKEKIWQRSWEAISGRDTYRLEPNDSAFYTFLGENPKAREVGLWLGEPPKLLAVCSRESAILALLDDDEKGVDLVAFRYSYISQEDGEQYTLYQSWVVIY